MDVMATHESSVDVATAQDVDMECPGDDPALCTVLVRELKSQSVFQLTARRKTKLENAQKKEVEEVRKRAIYSKKLIFFRVKLWDSTQVLKPNMFYGWRMIFHPFLLSLEIQYFRRNLDRNSQSGSTRK